MENRKHYTYIDIMKVWACVGVFIYHCILGSYRYNDLYIWKVNKTILSTLISFLHYFHVPTFFFCSGFLFAISCKKIDTVKKYFLFVLKRLYKLGIPFIVFSVFYCVFNGLFSSYGNYKVYRMNTIGDIFIHPVAQYWYLLTLFEILIIAPIIICLFKQKNSHIVLGIIFIIYIILALQGIEATFLKYLFLFFGGVYFNNHDEWCKRWIIPGLVLVIMIGMIYLSNRFLKEDFVAKCCIELLFSIVIVISFYFLMKYFVVEKNITFGKSLIKYTLHIYLLHTWVIGVAKILLTSFNLCCELQIILVSVMGFGVTYVLSIFIKKIKIFNFWFEPTMPIKERASSN